MRRIPNLETLEARDVPAPLAPTPGPVLFGLSSGPLVLAPAPVAPASAPAPGPAVDAAFVCTLLAAANQATLVQPFGAAGIFASCPQGV